MEGIEGFDYVIKRPLQTKLFFGSGIERECLPLKGKALESFPRSQTPEILPNVHPTNYQSISWKMLKTPAKSGYGPLAYKSPRLPKKKYEKFPEPGHYTIAKPQIKPSFVPFNRSLKEPVGQSSLTPGPGTYTVKKYPYPYIETFGGPRKVIPATRIICTSRQIDICDVCGLYPNGDYWKQWDQQKVLCRPCMASERHKTVYMKKPMKTIRYDELLSYQRVRLCSFYHDHQGTTAGVRLLTDIELKRKLRRENYLAMFGM